MGSVCCGCCGRARENVTLRTRRDPCVGPKPGNRNGENRKRQPCTAVKAPIERSRGIGTSKVKGLLGFTSLPRSWPRSGLGSRVQRQRGFFFFFLFFVR